MRGDRILLAIFGPLVRLIFPFRVIGREHMPPAGDGHRVILCCNHISYLDPIFLLVGQKRPIRFMAKAELFKNRFIAWVIGKQFGVFAVERGKGDTSAIDTAKAIVEQGEVMGIFPEGTRSKDGKLGRAKSGAALIASQTGADILPVGIVTKNQKVRPFRRSTVVIGELMTPEELHLQNPEHPELRYASRLLMERIGELQDQARKAV